MYSNPKPNFLSLIFQIILSTFHCLAFHFSVLGIFFSPLYRQLAAFFFFLFPSYPLVFLQSHRVASSLCLEFAGSS
uniref:Putative product n=1 Tax=Xenopsylla cheopis TaxID=163159 RepID=A0A6M2DZQ2_XENCH